MTSRVATSMLLALLIAGAAPAAAQTSSSQIERQRPAAKALRQEVRALVGRTRQSLRSGTHTRREIQRERVQLRQAVRQAIRKAIRGR